MFVVNTDTVINSLSSLVWNDISFINTARGITDTVTTSSVNGANIQFLNFSDDIKSIDFSSNYYCFLMNSISISSLFSSITSINTVEYGMSGRQDTIKYSTIANTFSSIHNDNNIINMLGIVTSGTMLNIIPLKNKYSVDGLPYRNNVNHKDYQKVYNNYNNFLQFKITDIPIILTSDMATPIVRSYGVSASTLADMNFIEFGAVGGSCPANSDNILFDTSEYSLSCVDYTGRFAFNNGTMLCAWLSSQTHESSSAKVWMERWYDPNTVTQGNKFISSHNTLSAFTHIIDIPSSKIIYEKEKITYIHYGPIHNDGFVYSLSTNLVMGIFDWEPNVVSSVGNISGVVVGNYNNLSSELVLDGNTHVHIPPTDTLEIKNDITVSLWVHSDNWLNCADTQFFGNFYNGDGYGLGYTTGKHNSLITIPTMSGNCMSLNTRGFKVFNKDILSDLGLSASSITYIKNDIFDNKWLYDAYNKSIYKLENDDIINYTITVPDESVIVKMECNSRNELFILDSTSNSISSFDSTGILLSSGILPVYYDNFEIGITDSIIYDNADFLIVDNVGNVIKLIGSTLYNNNIRILHLTDKPTSIKIDAENYIWILFKNKLIKVDNTGKVIFAKTINIILTDYSAEMGFVSIARNGKNITQLWIIFNTDKKLIITDLSGVVVRRINIGDMLISNTCNNFSLDVHGDFTGFDNKRKFEQVEQIPISPTNPAICLKLGAICGEVKKYVEICYPVTNIDEWTHVAFTFKNTRNTTEIRLYINGILRQSEILDGNYSLSYGSGTSPFIIGGASGKLGAKNLEKSVTVDEFFIGKIDDVRIYSTALDDFSLLHLAKHNHFSEWSDMNYFIEVSPITLIEEIEQLHINRYKGFKSNMFNIKIKNFTDDPDLRNVMIQYILDMINKIKPSNTILNNIVFE